MGAAVPSKPVGDPTAYFPLQAKAPTYKVTSGPNTGRTQTLHVAQGQRPGGNPAWRFELSPTLAGFLRQTPEGDLLMPAVSDGSEGVIVVAQPANPFVPKSMKPGETRPFSQKVAVNYLDAPTDTRYSGSLSGTYTFSGSYESSTSTRRAGRYWRRSDAVRDSSSITRRPRVRHRISNRASIGIAAGMVAALLLPVLAATAKGKEKEPERPPIVDPRADELLRQMGSYLAESQRFSFQADIDFDKVLPTGQKVQFAAIEDVAVQRPNRAYVEYQSDLGAKRLWYDGKQITLLDAAENVYATASVSGKLDAALGHMIDAHGFSPPLADLLYSNPYTELKRHAQFGIYLGLHDVDGTRCHHLAFVDKQVDWQVWIEDGTQTVPRKLVVTYKTLPGSPQFVAVLSEWRFDERFAETIFTPKIPGGVMKIDFVKAEQGSGKP